MSNQNDLTALHHSLKDIDRQLKKNAGQLSWILILAAMSLAISVIGFVVHLAK